MSIANEDGPKTLVYSDKAASKAALSETIQHPLTIWPPAIGVATGVGLTILGFVSMPVAIAIGSGCVFVGGLNWALRFFGGKEAYVQKYYAELHNQFEKLKEQKARHLASDLKSQGCEQGSEQVEQFEDKFQSFLVVLGRIFNETELTYSRYVGSAEQLYRKGLENLERIVTLLISISEIDRDRLKVRIKSLERKEDKTSAEERILASNVKQAELYDNARNEVDELLATNEEALATIDAAAQAALRVKENSDAMSPGQTMDEALQILGDMIARTNRKPSVVSLCQTGK